jgi:PAS domain-containing protein
VNNPVRSHPGLALQTGIKPEQNRPALIPAAAQAQLAAHHVLGKNITARQFGLLVGPEQAPYQSAHMPKYLLSLSRRRTGQSGVTSRYLGKRATAVWTLDPDEGARGSAVQPSEDSDRVMINSMPVMAWRCRPDGFVEFFNRRWLEYVGLSLDQALGWG